AAAVGDDAERHHQVGPSAEVVRVGHADEAGLFAGAVEIDGGVQGTGGHGRALVSVMLSRAARAAAAPPGRGSSAWRTPPRAARPPGGGLRPLRPAARCPGARPLPATFCPDVPSPPRPTPPHPTPPFTPAGSCRSTATSPATGMLYSSNSCPTFSRCRCGR